MSSVRGKEESFIFKFNFFNEYVFAAEQTSPWPERTMVSIFTKTKNIQTV